MVQFECDICEENFNFRKELLKHYNQIHKICEKVIKCNICSKSFRNKYILAKHNGTVHGGKNKFNCKYLAKHFYFVNLVQNMVVLVLLVIFIMMDKNYVSIESQESILPNQNFLTGFFPSCF